MSELLAADSWLVDDGRVRAVERHWARFEATCGEHGVLPETVAALRAEVERAIPARGRRPHLRRELAVGAQLDSREPAPACRDRALDLDAQRGDFVGPDAVCSARRFEARPMALDGADATLVDEPRVGGEEVGHSWAAAS